MATDSNSETNEPTGPLIEADNYAEEAPLTYLFGDSARVKIIGAFVAERNNDVSISDVARYAGVARSTVYNHIGMLEKFGFIEQTREVDDGHSSLYQLNSDSDIAELCYKLEGTVLTEMIDNPQFE